MSCLSVTNEAVYLAVPTVKKPLLIEHKWAGSVKILLLLCLILPSFSARAASGWTDYGYVSELVPTIHHRFKVNIVVNNNKSGCKDKQWFYQDYNAAGAKEMYLALLEAVASNLEVRVYVTGRCNIDSYSEISELGIRR